MEGPLEHIKREKELKTRKNGMLASQAIILHLDTRVSTGSRKITSVRTVQTVTNIISKNCWPSTLTMRVMLCTRIINDTTNLALSM